MPSLGRPLLICFAMPEEARPFRQLIETREDVTVLVTGMGRQNTEHAFRTAVQSAPPSCTLTCGWAGGLDPSLAHNDILWETSIAELEMVLDQPGARRGRFFCSERMAVSAEEKASLRQQTGADAVEMESHWIHQLCRLQQIPCATVRVISDTAGETMPLDFNKLTTAGMKMSYRKLLLALLRHPTKLSALLKLQRQTQSAAIALAHYLQRVVAS